MGRQMNIGFVLYGNELPAWYAESIALVAKENHRLFFLRFRERKKENKRCSLVYQLFSVFEEKWFTQLEDAHKPVPLTGLHHEAEVMKVNADGYWLDEADLVKLNSLHLDVIYTIDFHPFMKENLSSVAKQGLWYVHFGYGKYNNSKVPAFWEVMKNEPVSGSYLLMRKEGVDSILYEGTAPVVPFSVRNTYQTMAWKASSYLLHRTRTLMALPTSFGVAYQQVFKLNVERQTPGNRKMLALFLRNLWRYLHYKRKLKNGTERFRLLFTEEAFTIESLTTARFTALPLPPGRFFADPFVVQKDGVTYLFFEDYNDAKGKAHISVIEIDRQKNMSPPHVVLERPYHLSYPFVFVKDGEYYLLPETSSNRTVELYKAVAFPHQWELAQTLLEGQGLIDCTLFFYDSKWWLFANQASHPAVSTNDQLFLFYCEELFSSQWISHPKNPVATHAGNCRPAGRIFEKDGKLYRPAQNNASLQYGYGLNINEIEVLTTDDYCEKTVLQIFPETLGLKAVHHLDVAGNFIVIDGIV